LSVCFMPHSLQKCYRIAVLSRSLDLGIRVRREDRCGNSDRGLKMYGDVRVNDRTGLLEV
jgi:hypothetical protein